MANEVNNQGVEPNGMVNPDDQPRGRNTFAWIFYGVLAPIAVILTLWTFWLFDLI